MWSYFDASNICSFIHNNHMKITGILKVLFLVLHFVVDYLSSRVSCSVLIHTFRHILTDNRIQNWAIGCNISSMIQNDAQFLCNSAFCNRGAFYCVSDCCNFRAHRLCIGLFTLLMCISWNPEKTLKSLSTIAFKTILSEFLTRAFNQLPQHFFLYACH